MARMFTFQNVFSAYTGAITAFVLCYLANFYIFELYGLHGSFRSAHYLSRYILGLLGAASVIAIFFYIFPDWKTGRGVFLMNALLVSVFAYGWRLLFEAVFGPDKNRKGIVIIGAGNAGRAVYQVLSENRNGFRIEGFIDDNPGMLNRKIGAHSVIGASSVLAGLARRNGIGAAVMAIKRNRDPELLKAVIESKMSGMEIYDMPSIYEELTGRIPVRYLTENWIALTTFHGVRKKAYTTKIKRLMDFVLALSGLVLSLPVALVVAIAVKLDSKGPVLFRQKRVGLNGKVYELYKFRSMRTDAEANGAVWAKKDDPRVTRAGRVIRKIRADEIPQMWNVLKGDMSFIGPRPERPEFVDILNEEIPYYSLRHSIKPGITGWAQVNYRYGASNEDALEKLQYDLFYIKNLSPFLDLLILLRTVRVVLFTNGAR